MATMIARWISGVLAALRRWADARAGGRPSRKPAHPSARLFKQAVDDIVERPQTENSRKIIIDSVAMPPDGAPDYLPLADCLRRSAPAGGIPPGEWEWFGSAAHFCCGQWCRFHLATRVGSVVVSTVGELVLPHHSGGSGRAESEWLAAHGPDDVGCGRKYETEAFRVATAATCACGCGVPRHGGGRSLDSAGYNTAAEATAGHRAMCERWAQAPFRSGESREGGLPGKPAQG